MALHTDREYEADLTTLRQQFLRIGGLVEHMIGDALRATFQRDEQLALSVAERDKEVNRSELDMDELCLKVLALRQPTASDLRFVTFSMKAITDLERIGDLAVNVADRAAELSRDPPLQQTPELGRMAELAQAMLHDALDAFVNRDATAADAILTRDDEVDQLYWSFFRQLLVVMQNDRTAVDRAIRLLFVAKHVERLADHVTNLAELVIFMVRGQDIRHPRSRLAVSKARRRTPCPVTSWSTTRRTCARCSSTTSFRPASRSSAPRTGGRRWSGCARPPPTWCCSTCCSRTCQAPRC